MAIDGAVSQTAVEAWDRRWATAKGAPHLSFVAVDF